MNVESSRETFFPFVFYIEVEWSGKKTKKTVCQDWDEKCNLCTRIFLYLSNRAKVQKYTLKKPYGMCESITLFSSLAISMHEMNIFVFR